MKALIDRNRERRAPKIIAAGTAVAVLCLLPLFIKNDFYLDGLILIFLWGAFAGAWNILAGYAGMMSLGHSAFFGIGAYTSTLLLLHFGLTPWIGMLIGGFFALARGLSSALSAFALGVTISPGDPGLRRSRLYHCRKPALPHRDIGRPCPPHPASFYLFSFAGKLPYVYIGLFFFLMVIGVSYAIEHSRLGYFLMAFRENEDAARALGVKTGRVRLAAMVLFPSCRAYGLVLCPVRCFYRPHQCHTHTDLSSGGPFCNRRRHRHCPRAGYWRHHFRTHHHAASGQDGYCPAGPAHDRLRDYPGARSPFHAPGYFC